MSEKEFKFKSFEISGTDSFLNEVKLYEISNIHHSDDLDESNLFYVYSDSEDNIIQIVEKLNKLSEEKQKLNKQVTYWKSVALRDKKLCGQPLVLCQGYSSKDNKRFHLAFENDDWWSICDETNNSFEGKFYGISGQEVVDLLNTLDDKNKRLTNQNSELKKRLVENMSLIIMLANTTISGRVDNVIFNRGNYESEMEYYTELDKIRKELQDKIMDKKKGESVVLLSNNYNNGLFGVEDGLFYENGKRLGYFQGEGDKDIKINNYKATVDMLENLRNQNIILNQRNDELHEENKEILKDEKQLSIDFMGYKMKLVKVLRNHYLECQKWGDTHTQLIIKQIASDLGVDLE